jgi:hypothetical protein
MSLSEKMLELQAGVNRYGEATVRNFRVLHAFGDNLIDNLKMIFPRKNGQG